MADPFASPAQANPFAAPVSQQQPPQQQQPPFGYPPQQQQQPQQQPSPYQQPQQQPSPYQQPPPPHQQQSYDPFSHAPPQQQPPLASTQYNDALVPSQQPANPYAGLVAPAPAAPVSTPGSFDPFAAPPAQASQALVPVAPNEGGAYPGAPSPYQQQQMQTQQQQVQMGYQQQPPPQQYQQQQPPPQQPPPPPPAPAPAPPPPSPMGNDIVPAPSSGYPGAPRPPPSPTRPASTPTEGEVATPKGLEARNKYSGAIAQNAPLGASPLPRADMVKKTGYVLSRISFRTIVMKKWKQSFWVQYGPHTMLWFRSQSDFDDWLNNPYHTQAQRNFLIKLAVNFAHDLYKPNVRGYQVTQCRTKSYGTKLIRQFKLERWMDYGPTIAAAFGSNNPKEVDDLREALVACMRNTPLNGGIRATGAVRQGGPNGHQQDGYNHQGEIPSSPAEGYGNRSTGSASDLRADQRAFDEGDSTGEVTEPPAPPPDLLDFSAEPVTQPAPSSHQTSFHSQPAFPTQGAPMPPPQQQYPGTPQSHPPQFGASPPAMQQQQYPVQQQQQNFGPPPPMQQQQQQYPPQGQPQAFGGY